MHVLACKYKKAKFRRCPSERVIKYSSLFNSCLQFFPYCNCCHNGYKGKAHEVVHEFNNKRNSPSSVECAYLCVDNMCT